MSVVAARPKAVFRIHPCPDVPSRYVTVQVFRTFKEMRAWLARNGGVVYSATGRMLTSRSRHRDTQGCCLWRPKDRAIATVTLVEGYCGPRIVCHEFMHAAMAFALRHLYRDGLSLNDLLLGREGELLALFHGNLSSMFWQRYRSAGLRE